MDEVKIPKDLPRLIVGLDSLCDDANYIHIDDVKKNVNYYCPCCKGLIKPKAYAKDINYKVQPHFYHETGGCKEETYIHYLLKNLLFERGSKFIVNNTEYIVDTFLVEHTLHTSFGDYRPDLIVTTTSEKTFYFEVKSTNKKNTDYIPKWSELDNDVVEIDARYFINQKFENEIPVFDLIYSDGECFIKSYSRQGYEYITKRKIEWKRQDKLNYKIQWQKLDHFFEKTEKYKKGECSLDDLMEYFSVLDLFDKEVCFDLLKRQSCIKENNQQFRDIINREVLDYWNNNAINNIGNKISFETVNLQPKKPIYISYTFETIAKRRSDISSININTHEWILRPTTINKIIVSINKYINFVNLEIKRQKLFDSYKKQALEEIAKKFEFKGCIWNFSYGICARIEIYGGYDIHHQRDFYVSYDVYKNQYRNKDFTYEDVYSSIIDTLTCKMREIYKYVSRNDGKDSIYRHMFVSRKEVNEYSK